MSRLNSKDEMKLEQHAASVPGMGTSSPSRSARGGSPRLTPNRIFTSHLDCIIKNKEKERSGRKAIKTEVKVEEETAANGPTTASDMHLLEERQEPYGAECGDNSFGGVKEEIRVHLITEVKLIPLPGEDNSLTELVDHTLTGLEDDSFTGEDEVSLSGEDQEELPSDPPGSKKKNAMEELESSILTRKKRSKSSKKRKKNVEESPSVEVNQSPIKEARKHLKRSKKHKHSVQTEKPKLRRSSQIKEEDQDLKREVNEVNGKDSTDSSSIHQSLKDSTQGQLKESWGSVSPPRNTPDERSSSLRRHSSPLRSQSSSGLSTPVKTENVTQAAMHSLYHPRTLNPLSKMSSSENFVDVAVSSESVDDILDHEVDMVHDQERETETPSAMSSRSGTSTAPDFIPFCPPRPSYISVRKDLSHPSYVPNWHYPYGPSYEQCPSAMHQGVFDWQYHYENPSDAIAALVMYPPPPHPPRPLFPNLPPPPPPPGTASYYPIRRYSAPSQEPEQPPVDRRSLPSNFSGCKESSTEPVPVPASIPAVDRRFTCLQRLHTPPKPNIFGYQLIGDSMLVRFAQQILGQPPILQESLRFLGYCVSGQRIGDLLKRLKSDFYHLNKKVVLMIGTNDLVKNCQAEQMIQELRRVLELLCTKAEKIVVLTLPPIPRLEHFTHHWARLKKYNDFIRTLNNEDMGISVFDISPQYLLSKEELEDEELLAEFNSDASFCRGCLTCTEEVEELSDSSWSDEDDIMDTDLLTSVLFSTSSPVSHIDICHLYCSKRISKCKMDCFELKFSESSNRKDLIHLNRKGLLLVKDALYKLA